jgi:DNA-binding MarR family transcriptional regulator
MSTNNRYDFSMGTKLANDLQVEAWMAFHAIRVTVIPPLARHLSEHCGLSEAEYQVFIGLRSTPEMELKPSQLAEELGWEMGRLSHQICRMETKGLLMRKQCPVDARSCFIGMTKKGKALIDKALPLQLKEVKRLFGDALTNQQMKNLIEISESIIEHVSRAKTRETTTK